MAWADPELWWPAACVLWRRPASRARARGCSCSSPPRRSACAGGHHPALALAVLAEALGCRAAAARSGCPAASCPFSCLLRGMMQMRTTQALPILATSFTMLSATSLRAPSAAAAAPCSSRAACGVPARLCSIRATSAPSPAAASAAAPHQQQQVQQQQQCRQEQQEQPRAALPLHAMLATTGRLAAGAACSLALMASLAMPGVHQRCLVMQALVAARKHTCPRLQHACIRAPMCMPHGLASAAPGPPP